MTEILNRKGRPFSWSYSALNDFEGCPARYAERRFYCTLPYVETEATIWGNRLHKAGELFLQGINPKDNEALAPVEPYVTAMLRSGLRPEAELEIVFSRNFGIVSWFSKKAWFRMKIDIVLSSFDRKQVKMFDWKTGGKIRTDEDQLRLGAAALSVIRPKTELYEGKFIWTKHQQVVGIKPIKREEIKGIWHEFLPRVQRMEDAWKTENFAAKPSGLCPWCQKTDCVQRRGEMRR